MRLASSHQARVLPCFMGILGVDVAYVIEEDYHILLVKEILKTYECTNLLF